MHKSLKSSLFAIGLTALLSPGCAEGAPQPFGPTDSGRDSRAATDTSVPDAAADAVPDAATPDADAMAADADAMAADADAMAADADAMAADADAMVADADAMVADADAMVADADAMPPVFTPPTIDGVLSSGEWAGAESATLSLASDWGVGLNELSAVHAASDGSSVWVAVEGVMEATNAIVVYVDSAAGGVGDMSSLMDPDGSLDRALSSIISTPAGFAADYAFGTRGMSHVGAGFDDALGWRDIATDPTNFAWIDNTVAPSVCGTGACETRIPVATLGAGSGDTVRLFVRIVNAVGDDVSNQTLPSDMPAAPATVTMSLSVPVP